ncbi:hypothetical protein [Oceanicella actignis]|uniref:Holin n=1 Tax=Oceanicella actignis TaxID=1189325 RepID=A0A1M7U1N0_9RHOB|nr:hypothetical protein [Oceanicella actignis]SES76631.1 hypothetical protein SAMN04488119_101398 [Oceanicella actignis]SHN76941.1 hypothetical protein SAMN05216200_11424 [Oceanicella actignis]
MSRVSEYRKAIAALLAGLLGLAAHFIPGVSEYATAEIINLASVTMAAAAALIVPNTMDGHNVNMLARWILDEIAKGTPPDADADADAGPASRARGAPGGDPGAAGRDGGATHG